MKFTGEFHGKTEGFLSGLTQYLINCLSNVVGIKKQNPQTLQISWLQVYSYGKPIALKWLIFEPNFSIPGPEIKYCHFLLKQNTISQMNHIAINSSIWNSNNQILSDFEIYRSIFYFCGQTNPISTKCRLQTADRVQNAD